MLPSLAFLVSNGVKDEGFFREWRGQLESTLLLRNQGSLIFKIEPLIEEKRDSRNFLLFLETVSWLSENLWLAASFHLKSG